MELEKIVFQKSLKDKSQRILELGCGTGRISFGLAKLGYANLVCSDFSRKMVTRAKELNQRFGTGIKFEKQTRQICLMPNKHLVVLFLDLMV